MFSDNLPDFLCHRLNKLKFRSFQPQIPDKVIITPPKKN